MMVTKEKRKSAWNPASKPPMLSTYILGNKVVLEVYDIYDNSMDHIEMDIEAAAKLIGDLANSLGVAATFFLNDVNK